MSNVKRYIETIETLKECSQVLCELATDLEHWFDIPQNTEPSAAVSVFEVVPTLEDVRAVLADKARAGLTVQVRGLIEKYGAQRLSDVAPKHYAALLKDAEVLDAN